MHYNIYLEFLSNGSKNTTKNKSKLLYSLCVYTEDNPPALPLKPNE